jgi:hypothetical protein
MQDIESIYFYIPAAGAIPSLLALGPPRDGVSEACRHAVPKRFEMGNPAC